MDILKTAAMAALLIFSAHLFAARSFTSVIYGSTAETTDGIRYENYIVKCSNGKRADLTVWNNRTTWCVGDANSTACGKYQSDAASVACGGVPQENRDPKWQNQKGQLK
ncbi:MAG: hypothetical protein QMC02_10195 [Halioglobus sp.]